MDRGLEQGDYVRSRDWARGGSGKAQVKQAHLPSVGAGGLGQRE
jgi:hypothetical protein